MHVALGVSTGDFPGGGRDTQIGTLIFSAQHNVHNVVQMKEIFRSIFQFFRKQNIISRHLVWPSEVLYTYVLLIGTRSFGFHAQKKESGVLQNKK